MRTILDLKNMNERELKLELRKILEEDYLGFNWEDFEKQLEIYDIKTLKAEIPIKYGRIITFALNGSEIVVFYTELDNYSIGKIVEGNSLEETITNWVNLTSYNYNKITRFRKKEDVQRILQLIFDKFKKLVETLIDNDEGIEEFFEDKFAIEKEEEKVKEDEERNITRIF